jgi:ammonia channel protein AmtB
LSFRINRAEKTNSKNFGLFCTFWTIIVYNPSFSEWHFDKGEVGLTALLHFGDFSGGELLIRNPFNLKVLIQNWDLFF